MTSKKTVAKKESKETKTEVIEEPKKLGKIKYKSRYKNHKIVFEAPQYYKDASGQPTWTKGLVAQFKNGVLECDLDTEQGLRLSKAIESSSKYQSTALDGIHKVSKEKGKLSASSSTLKALMAKDGDRYVMSSDEIIALFDEEEVEKYELINLTRDDLVTLFIQLGRTID